MERKKKRHISNRFALRPSHSMDVVPQQRGYVPGFKFAIGHKGFHPVGSDLRKGMHHK